MARREYVSRFPCAATEYTPTPDTPEKGNP